MGSVLRPTERPRGWWHTTCGTASPPRTTPASRIPYCWRRSRPPISEAGIVIAETGAYALNILDTNPVLREQNFEKTCRRLERAERVGSLCCVGHGGTVSTGGWFAHNPENFSQASFDTTVSMVQRILDTVKPEHTTYVLETESRLLPDSPEIYRELVEAVDRPRFGVHLDPFNIISSPRRFYFSDDFIRQCFRLLAEYLVSCHSKDIKMVKDSQTHFHETFTGDGEIDYRAYIAEIVKLEQDVPDDDRALPRASAGLGLRLHRRAGRRRRRHRAERRVAGAIGTGRATHPVEDVPVARIAAAGTPSAAGAAQSSMLPVRPDRVRSSAWRRPMNVER